MSFKTGSKPTLNKHAKDWKDNVVQQSRSWVKQGLAERSATRDMAWGIPVPADDAEGKVLYVWFEAVLGYISATKQWGEQVEKANGGRSGVGAMMEGSQYDVHGVPRQRQHCLSHDHLSHSSSHT